MQSVIIHNVVRSVLKSKLQIGFTVVVVVVIAVQYLKYELLRKQQNCFNQFNQHFYSCFVWNVYTNGECTIV